MYCSPAPPSNSTPTPPALLKGMGEKQTHGVDGAAATVPGNAHETKPANAAAARATRGARTAGLGCGLVAGLCPAVSSCRYQHLSPNLQKPAEKNRQRAPLVPRCGTLVRAPPLLLALSLLLASSASFRRLWRSLFCSAFSLLFILTKPVGRGGSATEPGAGQSRRESAGEEDSPSAPSSVVAALSCSKLTSGGGGGSRGAMLSWSAPPPGGGGGAGKACCTNGAGCSNMRAGSCAAGCCAVLARISARTGEGEAGVPAVPATLL